MINYDTFKKVELKIAKIIEAERVEGSDKLIRLKVDLGERDETGAIISKQIVAGIGVKYQPEDIINKNIIIVANLEPRKLMGIESQGMLLAASNDNEGPILLTVMEDIASGSEVR